MRKKKRSAASRKQPTARRAAKASRAERPRLSLRARKQMQLVNATIAGIFAIFVLITLLALTFQKDDRANLSPPVVPALSPDAPLSTPVAAPEPIVPDSGATMAEETPSVDSEYAPEPLQSPIGPPTAAPPDDVSPATAQLPSKNK